MQGGRGTLTHPDHGVHHHSLYHGAPVGELDVVAMRSQVLLWVAWGEGFKVSMQGLALGRLTPMQALPGSVVPVHIMCDPFASHPDRLTTICEQVGTASHAPRTPHLQQGCAVIEADAAHTPILSVKNGGHQLVVETRIGHRIKRGFAIGYEPASAHRWPRLDGFWVAS